MNRCFHDSLVALWVLLLAMPVWGSDLTSKLLKLPVLTERVARFVFHFTYRTRTGNTGPGMRDARATLNLKYPGC